MHRAFGLACARREEYSLLQGIKKRRVQVLFFSPSFSSLVVKGT